MAPLTPVPESKPEAPDGFTHRVAEARANLSKAADQALPSHDPFRALVIALDEVVSVLPAFISRVEHTVDKSRSPLSADQQKVLCAEVVTAASTGAAHGARREATQLIRSTGRATAISVGLVVGFVGLLCGGGGYLAGRMSVQNEVVQLRRQVAISAASAQTWLDLMQTNPAPAASIAAAKKWVDQRTKRQAGLVPLYLAPDQTPAERY